MVPGEHPAERLLRWLEKNVTEQRAIGIQPVALVVLSAALAMALAWIWRHA